MPLVRDAGIDKLLDRLIKEINGTRRRRRVSCFEVDERMRTDHLPGPRVRPRTELGTAEYYTVLADQTFAWSNSEELVQGDRAEQGTEPGLSDVPGFSPGKSANRALPSVPWPATCSINPRFLESQIAAALLSAADPSDAQWPRSLYATSQPWNTWEGPRMAARSTATQRDEGVPSFIPRK